MVKNSTKCNKSLQVFKNVYKNCKRLDIFTWKLKYNQNLVNN